MIELVFALMLNPETVEVKKDVVYQQETVIDLSGSVVEGEAKLPPTFFISHQKTEKGRSLLDERLQFGLRDYNELGF